MLLISLRSFIPSPSRAFLVAHLTHCFPVSLDSRVVPQASEHLDLHSCIPPPAQAHSSVRGVGLFLHRHALCPSSASCCCNILLLPVHVASCSRLLGVWQRHVSSHRLFSSSLGGEGWRAPLYLLCSSIYLPFPPIHSPVYTCVHSPVYTSFFHPHSIYSFSYPPICVLTHLCPDCQTL